MKRSIFATALIILVSLGMPASAQMGGRRCGGWPGAPGVAGIIVGFSGETCSGALFGRLPPGVGAFRGARVAQAPAHGRFELTGGRTFAYTAPTTPSRDLLVLDVEWDVGGQVVHRPKRFQIMTDAAFQAAGGEANNPGAVGVTSRFTPRKGGTGFRN